MSATRKANKSTKDVSGLLNDSQFIMSSHKPKKGQKRQKIVPEEEDISKLIGMYQMNAKKKVETAIDAKETRRMLLEVLGNQMDARKQSNTELQKRLLKVITQIEDDYEVLKDNEQKLEHLTGVFLKCIQQTTNAQKLKLKMIKEIHSSHVKECEQMDNEHRTESGKLADELEKDMNKLQQQLISETKRKHVEGLLTRGAMKPDDRPLWFDIYRAFPPMVEPKFARPKPEIKPIRQIFYPEDVVRAKFHSQGHGYGAVHMLSPTGETQIKKLVEQYEKLKAEGISEDELVQKSVEAVGVERQQQHDAPKLTAKNPDSVTAHILKDANLKDIFTEEKK